MHLNGTDKIPALAFPLFLLSGLQGPQVQRVALAERALRLVQLARPRV